MIDIDRLSTPALAYLGDSVLELLVREALILKGFEKSSTLNKEALKYVTAVNQCKAFSNIENMLTEIEIGVLSRQCLSQQMISFDEMQRKVSAWQFHRNSSSATVVWRFTVADARCKLKKLYPTIL